MNYTEASRKSLDMEWVVKEINNICYITTKELLVCDDGDEYLVVSNIDLDTANYIVNIHNNKLKR